MHLESGPAKTDAIWHIARAVLFIAFALWFVYDGAIRYPARNQSEAVKKLMAPQHFEGAVAWEELSEHPTKAEFERLRKANPKQRAEVVDALGKPQFKREDREYFISRYGYATVPTLASGRVKAEGMEWSTWYKTRSEVQQQFYWGILPALPGLYFLWLFFKAITLRVTIDDEGMAYGSQRISFDQMVSLRDYNPKGWIDLYYRDGDREQKLRIDNEKIAKFDEIVDALCTVKGFKNEVRAHAERKVQQEGAADQDVDAADDIAPQQEDTSPRE